MKKLVNAVVLAAVTASSVASVASATGTDINGAASGVHGKYIHYDMEFDTNGIQNDIRVTYKGVRGVANYSALAPTVVAITIDGYKLKWDKEIEEWAQRSWSRNNDDERGHAEAVGRAAHAGFLAYMAGSCKGSRASIDKKAEAYQANHGGIAIRYRTDGSAWKANKRNRAKPLVNFLHKVTADSCDQAARKFFTQPENRDLTKPSNTWQKYGHFWKIATDKNAM